MKRIFTFLVLAFSAGAFAQSFSMYRLNSNSGAITETITNGYTLADATSPDYTGFSLLETKNNSAATITLNVTRTILVQSTPLSTDGSTATPRSYFCFGNTCFLSNVSTPTSFDYTILPPGKTSFEQSQNFYTYVAEASTQGHYIIRYKVFNVNDPNDTLAFKIEYNTIDVGFKNIESKELVSELYPNPNLNGSAVSFDLSKDEDLKFQVYNSLGALIYSSNTQRYAAGKNKLGLDCSTLNNGIYFVTVSGDSGKATKRLIINR